MDAHRQMPRFTIGDRVAYRALRGTIEAVRIAPNRQVGRPIACPALRFTYTLRISANERRLGIPERYLEPIPAVERLGDLV